MRIAALLACVGSCAATDTVAPQQTEVCRVRSATDEVLVQQSFGYSECVRFHLRLLDGEPMPVVDGFTVTGAYAVDRVTIARRACYAHDDPPNSSVSEGSPVGMATTSPVGHLVQVVISATVTFAASPRGDPEVTRSVEMNGAFADGTELCAVQP